MIINQYATEDETGAVVFWGVPGIGEGDNLALYYEGILMGYWAVDANDDGLLTVHSITVPLSHKNVVVTQINPF